MKEPQAGGNYDVAALQQRSNVRKLDLGARMLPGSINTRFGLCQQQRNDACSHRVDVGCRVALEHEIIKLSPLTSDMALPPRLSSPSLPRTSTEPSFTNRSDTSSVPPPKSYTRMWFTLGLRWRPKARAAAVGSSSVRITCPNRVEQPDPHIVKRGCTFHKGVIRTGRKLFGGGNTLLVADFVQNVDQDSTLATKTHAIAKTHLKSC